MRGQVDHRPDVRAGLVLAALVVGPVAGFTWWAMSLRDRLPDPVARHWDASGAADGFSSLTSVIWIATAMVLVIAVPLGVAAVVARQPSALRRCLAGTAAFLAVFVSVLVADSLRVQIDLADAALAPGPGVGIGVGTLAGCLAAVLAAVAVRTVPGVARAAAPPPTSAVRVDDPVPTLSWSARPAGIDVTAKVLAAVIAVGFVGLAVLLSWWLVPVGLAVGALIAGAGRITTTIDRDGLRARVLGIQVLHVPITDVAEADVVEVDPFWEFGGWGLRVDVAGRTGLVTRKGEAVRIRRGDDSEVLVTLDDAHGAAATLNSLADRVHGGA